MTTIQQRLREIASDVQRHGFVGWADRVIAIAAELEAPAAAADVVPVVAYGYENTRPTERAPLMMVRLSNAGDQYPELATKLVRQRDHLATVSALQARINALEARQVPDGSVPITQQKLAELIQEGFMAGAKRGIETAVTDLLAKGWSAPQGSKQDTSKEHP